jgi:hypothetical protein
MRGTIIEELWVAAFPLSGKNRGVVRKSLVEETLHPPSKLAIPPQSAVVDKPNLPGSI